MEKKNKKPLIIGAVCAALLVAFLGASAWRYFAVVLPEQQAAEAEETLDETEKNALSASQREEADGENGGTDKGEQVSYSGKEGEVWSILSGFTWTTPGGESYLSFADDGTVRAAAKGSTAAAPKEFEILSVEGETDSEQGCTVIARLGESYATMNFMSKSAAGEEAFAELPEADYRFSTSLFNDGAIFYKDPANEIETAYPVELPSFLSDEKRFIDAAVKETVKAELPAVSVVSWEPYVSAFYDDEGSECYMTSYKCNDTINTSVTAFFYPATKNVTVETSGAVSSTTVHTDAAGGAQ